MRTTDRDGSVYFSKIIALDSRSQTPFKALVYPNPVKDVLSIELEDVKGPLSISMELKDISGRVIAIKKVGTTATNKPIEIPMQGLASGIYFLTVTDGVHSVIHKIVK